MNPDSTAPAQQKKTMEVIRRLTRVFRDPFYGKKFRDVVNDEKVLELSFEQFAELLAHDSLREDGLEKDIFVFALRWLVYQKDRTQFMYQIFSHVRFYMIPKEDIQYCAALCKEHFGDTRQFTELITYAKVRDSPTIKMQQYEPNFANFSTIEERQEITLAEKGLNIGITDTWDSEKYVGNTSYVDNDNQL